MTGLGDDADTLRVPTYCRICEAACGLVATTDARRERVLDLAPDPDHVSTQGYACVKGIRFNELNDSPDRIRSPQRRSGADWQDVGWETALGEIGAKLAELRADYGPDAIGVYQGNPLAFSATAVFGVHGFVKGIGTRNVFSAGSQDCNNKFVVADRMYGHAAIQPIPDFDASECFIVIGSNPAISQMSFVHAPRAIQRLRAVSERGGRVVFVDPRRTESARAVGEHCFIRPGTDVFFLLSFLREVLESGSVDAASLAAHMRGFDELGEVAAAWTPERSAEATGIPADVTRDLVASYVAADGAALYCSTGVNQGPHGTLAFWLLNVVNAITGNLDRAGAMVVPKPPADLSRLAALLDIGTRTDRSRIGGFQAVIDTFPGAILADEIATPGEGQIRALVVAAGNPVLSFPNGGRLAAALDGLDLVVCVDMFRNETAEYADYVLPAHSWLEREDLNAVQLFGGFHPAPYVQYTQAVVEPAGDTRSEWWIFRELTHAVGVDFFGRRALGAISEIGRRLRRLPGLGRWLDPQDEHTIIGLQSLLARRPLAWLERRATHGASTGGRRGNEFLGQRVRTPDGRVDLAPGEFLDASADLDTSFADEVGGRERLKLISKRERHSHNSWTHNAEAFVGGSRNTNRLFINSGDAGARGLADGDRARVSTPVGSVDVPVVVTDDIMAGSVALPHGWGHQGASGLSIASRTAGVNVNDLAADGPDAIEPSSGMAHLTGFEVEVVRIETSDDPPATSERLSGGRPLP